MGRSGRLGALVATGLVAAAAVAAVSAGPAVAESTSTSCAGSPGTAFGSSGWPNQCSMVNDPNVTGYGLDRETWILDPGVGNFLTRDQLIAHTDDYRRLGFDQRFLWYAPMTKVHPAASSRWSACVPELRPLLNFCGHVNTAPSKTIGQDLQDDTLDAIAYGDNWIALACGNFNLPVSTTTALPVPVIHGLKYDDLNRNGVQDSGETGLPGITFTLSRVASFVGQPNANNLASATSDAAGDFSFALTGDQGPGTYVVTEQYSSDWPNTTPLTETIVVPEGAGDGEGLPTLAFGDREEVPPVAVAMPKEADQDSPEGASVTLDGSGSYSPTADPITYQWTGPFGSATGAYPNVVLPPGVSEVRLTVSDGIKSTTTATSVTVYPPITATPISLSAVEGQTFTTPVATFTDPDPAGSAADYVASIDWGDGTPSTAGTISKGTDGTFTVTSQHTYAEEGSYSPTVTITDDDVPYNTATVTAAGTVTDAPLQATGVDFLSTNPVNQTLATFTDSNPAARLSDFSAVIDWGDGGPSTAGVITASADGSFAVSGSHRYSALGYKTITVHITDIGGSTATAVDHLLLYATSGFVIGDLNSAVGTHVTYWGAQWSKLNGLSGGAAPAAFKGYQESPGSTSAAQWTTRPGDSSNPPGSVPTYMSVIVSTRISQDGSTISGDAPHVVIVRTDPGYASDPGHDGQGTVVAVLR